MESRKNLVIIGGGECPRFEKMKNGKTKKEKKADPGSKPGPN